MKSPERGVGIKITLLICVLSVLATASLHWPGILDALSADGDAIAKGQLWRWITGPFVHATWGHLLRDLSLLLFVGIAFEREFGRGYILLCLLGLAIPTYASLLDPEVYIYYGTSGLTHALLAAVLCKVLLASNPNVASPRWMAVLAGIGALALLAKVTWELATGTPLFPMDLGPGVRQVPMAHAVGAAVGSLFVWMASLEVVTAGKADANW